MREFIRPRTETDDITDSLQRHDMIDALDAADAIENTVPNEPIEKIENADPTEPIESTEFLDPMHRNEPCDQSDHFDVPVDSAALAALRDLRLRISG